MGDCYPVKRTTGSEVGVTFNWAVIFKSSVWVTSLSTVTSGGVTVNTEVEVYWLITCCLPILWSTFVFFICATFVVWCF